MKNPTKKRRLNFGVMFSTMDNTNQYDIWRGIERFASENDIHLSAYIGTYQDTRNRVYSFLETCFDTVSKCEFLDGIILFSGFLAQNAGLEKFDEYTSRLPKKLPIVSVSFSMPGVPSVLADGFAGIYGAVAHLIQEHDKKKIAFIKGPDGHPEAEERFAGYKKALEDNKITYDEGLVLPGRFIQDCGRAAVGELLDVRKLSADAIVACNDQMAYGVLNELKERNILVPSEVAVTGFDDDVVSATFIPSLSTARQDFVEIGRAGAEMLLKKIRGEAVEEVKYIAPTYVARQSCGCLEKEFINMFLDVLPAEADTFSAFVQKNFKSLFPNVPPEQIYEWAASLVAVITENPFSKEKFLNLFNEILVKYNHYYKELSLWQEALNMLTMGVELHSGEIKSPHSVLSTLISAMAFVHDVRYKNRKSREIALSTLRIRMRRVTSSLVLSFNTDGLVEKLSESLPSFDLNTALIGVYGSPIKSADPYANRTIETLIGFDGEQKFNMKHNSWNPILFSDYATIDHFDFERERRALFFIPLFFEDEEVGVILLPFNPNIPLESYDNLRVSVSTALKGAELVSTIQMLSVTDELTGLLNRRGFFQFVSSRLRHLRRTRDVMPIVMFMDMDGLKAINDTYGHKEGDVAIAAYAKILIGALREEDIIGRMGGDEFTVFSTVRSRENGDMVVKRIREKTDEYNAKKLHPYLVSSSIGSVILDDLSKESFEAAMLSADNVLYEEKMAKKKKGLSRA